MRWMSRSCRYHAMSLGFSRTLGAASFTPCLVLLSFHAASVVFVTYLLPDLTPGWVQRSPAQPSPGRFGPVRPREYGVDAALMSFQPRESGIHALCGRCWGPESGTGGVRVTEVRLAA